MSLECELRFQQPKLHLIQEDVLLESFAVDPGEAIVVFNYTEERQRDIRLLQCDTDEARIYGVDPKSLFTVLRNDGSSSTRIIDRETSYDFSQIRMITLNPERKIWETHILNRLGKPTGTIFIAKFV